MWNASVTKLSVHATARVGASGKGGSRWRDGGQQCLEPGDAGPTGGGGGGQRLGGKGSDVPTPTYLSGSALVLVVVTAGGVGSGWLLDWLADGVCVVSRSLHGEGCGRWSRP